MEPSPQTRLPSESETKSTISKKKPRKSEKEGCLTVISNNWGGEIAKIYFRDQSEKVAKLGRKIANRHHSWTEVSNMVNFAICSRVLEAHRTEKKSKAKDKNKEVKLQPKDWIKISDTAESTTESSDMLIKELSLLGFNVKIGKNGILEPDDKDLALLISLSTPSPEHQSPFSFPSPFDFVPPTVYKPPLSTKPPKEDTPKPQSEDTNQSAGCSTSSPEHARLGTSLPRCNVSPPALASTPQPLPSTTLNTQPLEQEVTGPNSRLKHMATEADPTIYTIQYWGTEPDPSIQHEANEPDLSLPCEAKPDRPPQHKTTKPDLLLQHEVNKPDPSPKHEVTVIHISPQQAATEPDPLVQHEATEANLPLQHKAAKPDPSPKNDATGTENSPQQEPLSFQYKAVEPDPPLEHEATKHDPSLKRKATESKSDAFRISAAAPKRRCERWVVKTPAGVKRKAVCDHAQFCDNVTTDCSCCRMIGDLNTRWHEELQSESPGSLVEGLCLLSALRYRRGFTDLCKFHFKRLVIKLGLNYTGTEDVLFQRIEEIWDARRSWDKLLSLKSRFPSWFTNTQDSTAIRAKSDSTSIACVSSAEEKSFQNVSTPNACVSGNEEWSIKNMNIQDAMTKFSDEIVAKAANLDVKIVRDFRNLVGAGDDIARSIGQLRLLHMRRDSEIIDDHQHLQLSPHGFKVVLDLPNMMTFCKDQWLSAQGINGALADLADPVDPGMQILSAEVGYLISTKISGSDQRPIHDHDIPNIIPGATTIILPWNIRNSHWVVVKTTCNKNRGNVTVYDSLRQPREIEVKTQIVSVMKEITRRNISHPWHESFWSEKDVRYSSGCAQQMGCNDCGVHTIYNAMTLAKGREPNKKSLDYPARRKEYFEAYCRFFEVTESLDAQQSEIEPSAQELT